MKKRLLKIALSATGATLLLGGGTVIPLTACSANNVKKMVINQYPQSFNIAKNQFDKICDLINNSELNFNNQDYVNANKFVLIGIKNTLDNEQKKLINPNTINSKNYVTNIDNFSNEKYLIISTILNNKKYTFSFNRQNGDIFYGGNNQASVGYNTITNNEWINLLNYNNSQFTQQFFNTIYNELYFSINLNNGALSPWLTNGFYDAVNQQTIFTLYGYYDNQPFNIENAIPVCNIAFNPNNNQKIVAISQVNPSITSYQFNIIGKDFDTIWNKKNNPNLINLIDILNTFTSTTINGVDGLIGNDQQLINSIETNISKLLQSLGNVNPKASLEINNLLKIIKNTPNSINNQQINDILNQLIALCKNPNTFAIYNKVASSLNQLLNLNNYNQFINLQTLNNSLEQSILNNNKYLIGNNFFGLMELFNGFGFNNIQSKIGSSNSVIQLLKTKLKNLWSSFIEYEFKGWGLRIASKIANDWLMIASPNNIYFDSTFTYYNDLDINQIKGSLYLKIINNTNETKYIDSINNKTIEVAPGQAFNFYLDVDKNDFTPYVYAENNKFKFGLKIKANTSDSHSFLQYGVFNKDATNIENDKEQFTKIYLNSDFNMKGMVSCGGNITNIKLNDITNNKDAVVPNSPSTQVSLEEQIKNAISNVFKTGFDNSVNIFNDLSIVTKAFSNENNTILLALSESAPAINRILVSLLNSIADLGNGVGSAITNLITIINTIQPNGTIPPILNTINSLLPQLKKILNYVPHLYKTLSNGKTVDMLGTFSNDGQFESENTKTFIQMIGGLIEGLLTSYKTKDNGNGIQVIDTNAPYALWDFLSDHINDLVGVLNSIGPITALIPNPITNNPITNNNQWKPTYPTNTSSPVDSIVPVIVTNFYNQDTGAPISLEGMKNIISGLDSIAPSIEGLLSNGGSIPPATISLITNLIKNVAATAVPAPEGSKTNAKSLLMFVSDNAQTIVDILNGINGNIGKIVAAILTAFTGNPNNASGFLDVTIGQLNGNQPSTGGGASSSISPASPSNIVNSPDNSVGTTVVKGFWDRLLENLKNVNNPQLTNIVNVLKNVAPVIGKLLNSISCPMKNDGTPYTSEELKSVFTIKFNKSNSQASINFTQPVYFDMTNVVNSLPASLQPLIFQKNWNNKYAVELNGSCLVYDLNGFNPSYTSDKKSYFVNGISAHLNYQNSNISQILGFINFNKIKTFIPIIKGAISGLNIPPILKTIINLALCDNDGSHFMYILFNLLLPNFGNLLNLNIGSNTINNDINEINPNNYVVIDSKLNNITLNSIDENTFRKSLENNNAFGNSFWTNIDKKLAFLNVGTVPNPTKIIYTSLVPLISIDKNWNRRLIKGVEFTLTSVEGQNNVYNIIMKPIFADSTFTTLIRNFVFTLLSSDVIQKNIAPAGKTNTITLTSYGQSLIKFIDSNLNSPITMSLLKDFGGSIKNTYNVKADASTKYLSPTSSDIALANLSSVINQTGWLSTDANFVILNKLINDENINKLISVSVSGLTQGGFPNVQNQTITLKIPNSILEQYNSSSPNGTKSITFKILWNKNITPTESITIPNTIPIDSSASSFTPIDPTITMTNLMNNLYNIATSPSGVELESQMGNVISNVVQFINSCMGYYPTINKIANTLNNNMIQSIINTFINDLINNANNDSWWLKLESLIGSIINH